MQEWKSRESEGSRKLLKDILVSIWRAASKL
jgi:hypothetical protein